MCTQDWPEAVKCLQVRGRVLFPGAAMFEAVRAAVASLCTQKLVPDLALQDAVIPAPLMLQKPQVIYLSSPAHSLGVTLNAKKYTFTLQSPQMARTQGISGCRFCRQVMAT